jgi:hypothetical protein
MVGAGDWTFDGKPYDKKTDILADWAEDSELYLSAKKKIIQEYIDQAKFAVTNA